MPAPSLQRDRPPYRDAETLVRGASAVAASMYGTFSESYPELRRAGEGKWNILVTAATLHLATSILREDSPEWWIDELSRALREEISDQAAFAMGTLTDFVSRTAEWGIDPHLQERAVGYWVLSGLFGDTPEPDQVWLAVAIGEALGKTCRTLVQLTLISNVSSSRLALRVSS